MYIYTLPPKQLGVKTDCNYDMVLFQWILMFILLKLAFLINCLYAHLRMPYLTLSAPNTPKLEKKNFNLWRGNVFNCSNEQCYI